MFGVTQSYVESILKVISPTKNHTSIYANSGLILFRSITENLINLSWIYACKDQKNAVIFSIDRLQNTLKFSKRYKDLMIKYDNQRYPTWDLTFGDKQQANDWDEYIDLLKNNIAKEQKKYRLPTNSKLPPIEQRCMQHDNYLKRKGELRQSNSLEILYVTYYPYFSGITHLTVMGLDTFIKKSTDDLSTDSHPEEIEMLAPITYSTYLALLEIFLKKFEVYEKTEMKAYERVAKSM